MIESLPSNLLQRPRHLTGGQAPAARGAAPGTLEFESKKIFRPGSMRSTFRVQIPSPSQDHGKGGRSLSRGHLSQQNTSTLFTSRPRA